MSWNEGTIMPRRETKKEAIESPGRTPQKYVVRESEIRDFIGSLSVLDVTEVAARFQVVADLTSGAFEERIDRLDESDLSLIKRIAGEDDGVHYQRLMTAIIAGVGQGRRGINAAHLTARRAVEFAFRCTRDYFAALHSFSRDLRLRQLDRSSGGRPAVRRLVSHR
jgi:hypothetical protein